MQTQLSGFLGDPVKTEGSKRKISENRWLPLPKNKIPIPHPFLSLKGSFLLLHLETAALFPLLQGPQVEPYKEHPVHWLKGRHFQGICITVLLHFFFSPPSVQHTVKVPWSFRFGHTPELKVKMI